MKLNCSFTTILTIPTIIAICSLAYLELGAKPSSTSQATTIATASQETRPAKLSKHKTSNIEMVRNTSSLIDQAVMKDLKDKKIIPYPLVDDATFLRRTYVKIIGRIPTHQEAKTFLKNKSTNKRATLIDELIYSPGFNSSLFNYWADMLRLRTNQDQHGLGWHVWLRDAVDNNMPYDKMVYDMLAANGHVSKNPAVAYYLRDRNMLLDNISNTVQVFLGTQIGCAQCHDHPFEDWTQKSYYRLAAFASNVDYTPKSAKDKINEVTKYLAQKEGFHQMGNKIEKPKKKKATKEDQQKYNQQKMAQNKFRSFAKKTSRDLNTVFKDFGKNEVALDNNKVLKLPHDYQYNDGKPGEVVKPAVLFGDMPTLKPGQDRLEAFADWVTNPKNPQFTKTIANRLWKRVYGYALAEPIDDWTDSTKVSHPEALAMVEKLLHTSNYNIRETLRVLYHMQLFEREVTTVEIEGGKAYQFQGPILMRLSAEQIHDSLITLENGNIDNKKNTQFKGTWNNYTQSIDQLLTSSPEMIIKIDDMADKTEAMVYDIKKENRALKIEKDKAVADGNVEKEKEISKKISHNYQQMKETQRKAKKSAISNSTPAMAEMAQMSMMMNSNLRVKDKGASRASEKAAPAKNGNLLHQFGASDRQTPDAASTHASIPQALTLLNGREVVAVSDRKGSQGSLPALIREAKTDTEKLEILFISLYGCYPTDAERSKYIKHMENDKTIQVFAKAMLNSKRFLFVK